MNYHQEASEEWECPCCGSTEGTPIDIYWREWQGDEAHGGSVELSGEACTLCKGNPDYPECCEFCGGPEPCSSRACIEALQAQADYWEGTIWPSDWSKR